MEMILEFIYENYIWVIGAIIVLLMALIGYIADKTDFGRKNINDKNKTKEENLAKHEKEINNIETTIAVETLNDEVMEKSNIEGNNIDINEPIEKETVAVEEDSFDINEIENNEANTDIDEQVIEGFNHDLKINSDNQEDSALSEKNIDNSEIINNNKLPEINTLKDSDDDDNVWDF